MPPSPAYQLWALPSARFKLPPKLSGQIGGCPERISGISWIGLAGHSLNLKKARSFSWSFACISLQRHFGIPKLCSEEDEDAMVDTFRGYCLCLALQACGILIVGTWRTPSQATITKTSP